LTNSAALWSLSMAGHAIGTKRKLKVKTTWSLLPNISTNCVAASGTKKSPTLNLVAYPIRNHEDETSKVILDTTLEALHFTFKDTDAVIIIRDELKSLFSGFNKYNRGSDEAQSYATLMDGSGGCVLRKKEGSFEFPEGRSFEVTGTIQPALLKRLNPELIDGGLLARFFYAREENIFLKATDKEISKGALENYNRLIYRLYELPQAKHALSIGAKEKYFRFSKGLFSDTNLLDEDDPLRPLLAKVEGNMFRVALILRCCDEVEGKCSPDNPVEADHISRAVKIISFAILHGKRVFDEIFESKNTKLEKKIIQFIKKKGPSTPREINHGIRGIESSEHARTLLNRMAGKELKKIDKRRNRQGEYYNLLFPK